MTRTHKPTVRCPEEACEDGQILVDVTRRSDWEPREVREDCSTCDGSGRVGSWTCAGGCDRDLDCADEMPAKSTEQRDGTEMHECRECVPRAVDDLLTHLREKETTR